MGSRAGAAIPGGPTQTMVPLAYLLRRCEAVADESPNLALWLIGRAAAALHIDHSVTPASRAAIERRLERLQKRAIAALAR